MQREAQARELGLVNLPGVLAVPGWHRAVPVVIAIALPNQLQLIQHGTVVQKTAHLTVSTANSGIEIVSSIRTRNIQSFEIP